MFGVKIHKRRDLVRGLTLALISFAQNQRYDTDQRALYRIFWPTVKQDVVRDISLSKKTHQTKLSHAYQMAHDSFHCEEKFNFLPTFAFPTRRVDFTFVSDGPSRRWIKPSECPVACRPDDHKDWIYC